MKSLVDAYGLKFLLLISLIFHFIKGFNMSCFDTAAAMLWNKMGVEGPRMDVYNVATKMPFSMKPIVAIMSDLFPICGYRKTPYMLVTCLMALVGLAATCFIPLHMHTPDTVTIGLVLARLHWSFVETLAEGFYSAKLRENPEHGTALVGFVKFGELIVSIAGTWTAVGLKSSFDPQKAFVPVMIPSLLLLYPLMRNWLGEKPLTAAESREIRSKVLNQRELLLIGMLVGTFALLNTFVSFVTGKDLQYIHTIFMCAGTLIMGCVSWIFLRPLIGNLTIFTIVNSLAYISPSEGVLNYFLTNKEWQFPEGPHFPEWFAFSVNKSIGFLLGAVVVAMYTKYAKQFTFRFMFALHAVLHMVLSLPNSIFYARLNVDWGISDYFFILGDTVLEESVYYLGLIPNFLIISKACPANVESTTIAISASVTKFARSTNTSLGAMLARGMGVNPKGQAAESAQFDNLWLLNIICSFCHVVPLAALKLLPDARQNDPLLDPDDTISATVGSPYQRWTGSADRATLLYLSARANKV